MVRIITRLRILVVIHAMARHKGGTGIHTIFESLLLINVNGRRAMPHAAGDLERFAIGTFVDRIVGVWAEGCAEGCAEYCGVIRLWLCSSIC